jgi:hypothetical protein
VFDRAGVDRHVGRSQNGLRKPIESDTIGINSSAYRIGPVQCLESVDMREVKKEERAFTDLSDCVLDRFDLRPRVLLGILEHICRQLGRNLQIRREECFRRAESHTIPSSCRAGPVSPRKARPGRRHPVRSSRQRCWDAGATPHVSVVRPSAPYER